MLNRQYHDMPVETDESCGGRTQEAQTIYASCPVLINRLFVPVVRINLMTQELGIRDASYFTCKNSSRVDHFQRSCWDHT